MHRWLYHIKVYKLVIDKFGFQVFVIIEIESLLYDRKLMKLAMDGTLNLIDGTSNTTDGTSNLKCGFLTYS